MHEYCSLGKEDLSPGCGVCHMSSVLFATGKLALQANASSHSRSSGENGVS